MANRKKETPNRSQVERLVDIMFSDAVLPVESMNRMRAWLVDPDKAEEKSNALESKFMEIFKFNPEPVLAPQLWPELARRLGMDETPVVVAYDPLAPIEPAGPAASDSVPFESAAVEPEPDSLHETEPSATRRLRKLSFGRIAVRVAAVLVPALLVLGTALWIADRRSQDTLVEITVPAGTIQTILLPDGSRVEAGSGAVVSYNEKSFADRRFVTLSGEALFDVADVTDESGVILPFTVEADNITVNVLGTIFRLAGANESSGAAAVSLYEGSVGVTVEAGTETEADGGTDTETVLAAGERLRVNTLTGERTTELIPASEMAAQGVMPLLRFDESSLGDLMLALGMNFDVEFSVAEGIDSAKGRYTADFEGLSLDEVLEMLSMIDAGLSFERGDDELTVNIRRK